MKVRHYDIEIPNDDPFRNCKLNRKQYAEVLTDIVATYADGFVLAVNNPWGTGKTTFIKMWEQHLENNDYKTLYFNAWENDFEPDVLVAMLSELEEFKDSNSKKLFETVLDRGAVLTTKFLPAILKKAAEKYAGDEVVEELVSGAIEEGAKGLRDQIKAYTSRKEGREGFRKKLEEFIEKASKDKPIVFIIDELDRCRPSYAVEVLEQIKHVFSVQGIVFVLSIDKIQLGHAICGYYGSEGLDADEYLRRFIDLEYSIPPPNTKTFCKYLYDYFEFGAILKSKERLKFPDFSYDSDDLIDYAMVLFDQKKCPLRQQERYFSHLRLILRSIFDNEFFLPNAILLLLYMKQNDLSFYQKIAAQQITPQDIVDWNDNSFNQKMNDKDIRLIMATCLLVTSIYNYSLGQNSLITRDSNENLNLSVKMRLALESDTNFAGKCVSSIDRRFSFSTIKMQYLINKIELVDNLI